MRTSFLLSVLCLFWFHLPAQKTQADQFILTGKIIESKNPIVYLIYTDKDGNRIKDSCKLQEGEFRFKGSIKEPTLAILRGNLKIMDDAENPNFVDFFIDPTAMTATVSYNHFKEIKITGSKTQTEYEMLLKQYDAIDKNSDSLYEKFSNVNQAFINNHPDSYISAFELWQYKTRWTIDSVKSFYAKLQPDIQNSNYGKEVKQVIDEIENNSIGKTAKAFKTIDINGNPLSLSDFQDKYVLLDFWGSWCVPCRQGMPHLIDLFNRYHNQGFDVIAIAEEYNQTEVPWRDAVKKDRTGIWHNILSGIKFNSDGTTDQSQSIVKLFGVHAFPTKILIDTNGIIIGRYTGTEEEPFLDKKLKEIFK